MSWSRPEGLRGLRGSAISRRHLLIIGVLVLAFSMSFMIRAQPLDYGTELNEFDPFFNYRATEYIVENGLGGYLDWHEETSWYPMGRDISATSQNMLHYTAAFTYQVFGAGSTLYDYTVFFPAVIGSLTAVVVFALVRVIGGTSAGLIAAILFSVAPPVIVRGTIGWFKSEPLGLFYGLIGIYLFLSGIRSEKTSVNMLKMAGGGVFIAFGLSAWGGVQFFLLPLGVFFLVLPFLRGDHKFQIRSVSIFTVTLFATLMLFESPGASFITGIGGFAIIGPAIFLIVCNIVQMFSKESVKIRNGLFLLAGSLGGGVALIVASFSTDLLRLPQYRYLNAINPFMTTNDPLTDSIAEHATTTLSQSFFFLSVLMVFSAIGVWLVLQKRAAASNAIRNEMIAFALIVGIMGVYISSAFIRLELFASLAVTILGSLGASMLISGMLRKPSAAPGDGPLKKKPRQAAGYVRIIFLAGIVALLAAPLFLPTESNWVSVVKSPPSILNGATVFQQVFPDWPDALEWIKSNTPPDSIVASWWDYGYWITTMSERTTLADNGTFHADRIEDIAKMFLAAPDEAWAMLQGMEADYVLIFIAAQRVTPMSEAPLYQLHGGADESKKHWFVSIAGEEISKHIHSDGMSGTPHFWDNTMLGKMIPFELVTYYNPVSQQESNIHIPGYIPIYQKSIKFAGGPDDPLKLVYQSPSYESSPVVTGVFIYEVNKEYAVQG